MKFPTAFTRYKGTVPAGAKALGADTTLPVGRAGASTDNVLSSRFVSINGWPVTRVAVAAKYTGVGSPIALDAWMYFYEDNLGLWIPTQAAATPVTPGTAAAPKPVVFFDVITLTDLPHVKGDLDAVTPGSISQILVVADAGGAPDGQYDFVIGADLTQKPF